MNTSMRLFAPGRLNPRFGSIRKIMPDFICEEEEDDLNDDTSFHTCASHASLLSSLFSGSDSSTTTTTTTPTAIAEDDSSSSSLSLPTPSPPLMLSVSESSPAVCRPRPVSALTASPLVDGEEIFSPRPITRSCFANLDNPRKDFVLRKDSSRLGTTSAPSPFRSSRSLGPSSGRSLARAPAPAPLPFPHPPLPALPTDIDVKPRTERKNGRPRLSKSMSFLPKVYFSSVFTPGHIAESTCDAVHVAPMEIPMAREDTATEPSAHPSRPRPRSRPFSTPAQTDHKAWTSSVGRFAGRLGLKRRG